MNPAQKTSESGWERKVIKFQMSSTKEQGFSQLFKQAFSLNQLCLSHAQQLTQLLGFNSLSPTDKTPTREPSRFEVEQEVSVKTVKSLSFQALTKDENEKRFVLRVEGGKKSLKWRSLKSCFDRRLLSFRLSTLTQCWWARVSTVWSWIIGLNLRYMYV